MAEERLDEFLRSRKFIVIGCFLSAIARARCCGERFSWSAGVAIDDGH